MEKEMLPQPDKNGIIKALPDELSEQNIQRINKFGAFMFLYDFVQEHFVRPRLHKADPQRHREILRNLISPVKKSHVLDIACGTGGAIPHFDSSNEYTGLDLSYSMLKQAVKKAKKKSFKKSRFIQGNAEGLLFEDESFGFILMDTALHMIPKYQLAISETARVLTKSGVFVCSTPAIGINKEFDITWKKISDKRDLHSFTEKNIEDVCSRNGLSYRRINTNGGVLYFQAQKK
ncbi:MAG TPA: methyltransferase domain-containing protein [Desulfobacteraceae bacterium]|nr:methyltransferase domain-containing protein [Desulfobacteraceae bacterium]